MFTKNVTVKMRMQGEEFEVFALDLRNLGRDDGLFFETLTGEIDAGTALITLEIPRARNLMPFVGKRDGSHQFTPMRDCGSDTQATFTLRVPIRQGETGLYTKWPENNFHLVLFGEKGRFEIWQISIVTQNGNIFFCVQRLYQGQAFGTDEGPTMPDPRFSAWTWLWRHLEPLFRRRKLPSFSEATQTSEAMEELTRARFGNNRGSVKWFNVSMGTGAITTDQGDVKLHWSDIPEEPFGDRAPRYLNPGTLVSYAGLQETHGERTGFLYRARAVQIA